MDRESQASGGRGPKPALRAAALAARRSLAGSERQRASREVVSRLLDLPELRDAEVVVLYAALADETDVGTAVTPLLLRGARTVFPRVEGDRLVLVAASDPRTLQSGYRGIREPVGPEVPLASVDAIVVPGVAFDPRGGRLGQGGGHYDRLLPTLPGAAVSIGVCFACQMAPDVPLDDHDVSVDIVVSDRAVYRNGSRA